MHQSAATSHRVQFRDFEVDLRAGELYRCGHKIKIQQRPFQVLSILLQNAGEVVTREELRQQVWPADTFVGFDHSLAVAVNKLREALCDSAVKPRFVETVGRRGYRFLAPVELPNAIRAGKGAASNRVSAAFGGGGYPPNPACGLRRRRAGVVVASGLLPCAWRATT